MSKREQFKRSGSNISILGFSKSNQRKPGDGCEILKTKQAELLSNDSSDDSVFDSPRGSFKSDSPGSVCPPPTDGSKHFSQNSSSLPSNESNKSEFDFSTTQSTSLNLDISSPTGSSPELEKAAIKFCDILLRNAKEVVGETQDPIELEHPVNKVELELFKGQGSRLSQGSRVQSYDSPKGNIKMNEIFEIAERESENEAKCKCLNPEARQRYVWKHGNRVLVTGQAGIGKSAFTRMVVQNIIENKMLPETKYIIYIKCRDIEFDEKLDIFDFILKYSVSDDFDFTPVEKKFIMKDIDNRNNVVVIFDAMDQAQTSDLTKSDVPKCRLKDCVPVSVIVRCLMNSQLLPRAKMLVTCRTRQAYQFAPEYRPSVVIKILGLGSESQKELGKQVCGRNFNRTYSIIRKDEDLESACYISVFCVILYAVLDDARNEKRTQNLQLNSITRVMMYLLDRYLRSDHMRHVSLNELQKVSRLARKGFFQKLLAFSPELIDEVGITQPALQGFMVTFIDNETKLRYRIFEGEHKFSFSHQLWQEFFTAIDIIFFAKPNVFDECMNKITNIDNHSRWEVIAKFLYGFTNKDTFEFIQSHLLPASKTVTDNWEERKQILWTTSEFFIKNQNQDSNHLIQVCNWIQETDEHAFTTKVSSRFSETFKLSGSEEEKLFLSNHDVRSVVRILYVVGEYSSDSSIKNLDFDSVEFTENSFRNFASLLSKRNGMFQEMRFHNCEFGLMAGNQIIRFMNKTERLHISYSQLSNDDILVMRNHYRTLKNQKLEVWIFPENESPMDFGEEIRRKKSYNTRVPVEYG